MIYACIKDFPNTSIVVGDELEIIKLENGEYIIDGAITTDSTIVYEFFEKKKLKGVMYSPYSHSKMETWVSCPKKFEYNYIIKPPRVEIPNAILEKGTLFHAILEFDMVDKLDEFSINDKFKALNKSTANEIIEQALIFTDESKTYQWIKSLDGIKVTEQEMFLGVDLEPVQDISTALIRGFIDLLIYDEKTKTCYIFDWKTGGKSKESLEKWPKPKDQLELYAVWAEQNFDVASIITAFIYVEHDHIAKYHFKKNDISGLKKKFKDKISNIETDNTFSKNLSQLCAWCDFRTLCLGISIEREPRSITLDEIKVASKMVGVEKKNKENSKNKKFFDKIKQKF
jgi:CRISPR/Cas system-associated exonuclease Cas4 (RecB family)